jgi:hypothetical protein
MTDSPWAAPSRAIGAPRAVLFSRGTTARDIHRDESLIPCGRYFSGPDNIRAPRAGPNPERRCTQWDVGCRRC